MEESEGEEGCDVREERGKERKDVTLERREGRRGRM